MGLLTALARIDIKILLEGDKLFSEFKGAITEQFVLQQLKAANNEKIYYWSAERSKAEIDFITQLHTTIFPIEVKAEENLQAKSLKSFYQKYPHTKAVRTSMSDFRIDGWLTNLPLFAIHKLRWFCNGETGS